MDIARDIRDFLMSRRARITPEQVGLTPGRRRRVPGLRREETAQLAGVSTDYYTQIERGNVAGVSDDVLQAVARALRLSDDETAHFFDLTRAAVGSRPPARTRRASEHRLPTGVQTLIDSMKLFTPDTFRIGLRSLEAPTLVVWGDKDAIIGVQAVDEIKANLKYGEYLILKDVGHTPILEADYPVSEAYIKFLDKAQAMPNKFAPAPAAAAAKL